MTKHFRKSCDKCLNVFDSVAHTQILSVTPETLPCLREDICYRGLADKNRTFKRISMNIFMIRAGEKGGCSHMFRKIEPWMSGTAYTSDLS